ncbi:MAG: DNA recombination protein RmuC [Desulfobacterales bacterium]|nr:DNA recombination protein RmuC [Desulfobacterales bacterium]
MAIGTIVLTTVEILLIGNLAAILLGALLLFLKLRRLPEDVARELREAMAEIENRYIYTQRMLKDEISQSRQEMSTNAQRARAELSQTMQAVSDSLLRRLTENAGMQKDQLDSFGRQLAHLTQLNEDKLETMRKTIENRLYALQQENNIKLEQMRATVDEKLHSTLEKRLGESFKQVSDRLEQVYKGLGEMRTLAAGVGDLKKVLTNVKTRGTWGEIQLGSILEQILTADQYAINVQTKQGSGERVEYAIKLPGRDTNPHKVVWMPIDSKFPQEDYQHLLDAQEAADKDLAAQYIKRLESRIKVEARQIKAKYIDPPNTTDFGIMFLPVEGLYAEVLRRPGLCDILQREYRTIVTGPTTLSALLNSLQMGFRTLAIEKRSSEVWELLGVVKAEFGKFGDVLTKAKKKLQEASHTIDRAAVRTRAIERKLRKVQELPPEQTAELLEADT